MKIGKFFKAIMKTVTVAIAIGSIAYIIKDILDKKASDNFDDTWDDALDEDFDDMFDDSEETEEDTSSTVSYTHLDVYKRQTLIWQRTPWSRP